MMQVHCPLVRVTSLILIGRCTHLCNTVNLASDLLGLTQGLKFPAISDLVLLFSCMH